MNLNQILNMVLRILLRRGVNWGVNKGIDLAARKGKAPAQMTEAERREAQNARDLAKRARKAARLTRRF